jgi:hypothetical protein
MVPQGRRVNARAHGDDAERHGAAVRWAAHSTWHWFVPGLLPYAGSDLPARYPVAALEWRGHWLPGWSVNQLRDPPLTQRGDQGSRDHACERPLKLLLTLPRSPRYKPWSSGASARHVEDSGVTSNMHRTSPLCSTNSPSSLCPSLSCSS